MLAILYWLGVKPSYSRPPVSDDNAFVESLFRTAKYRPEFTRNGFPNLDAARAWASAFVAWYNDAHRHSGLRYVSPGQRHAGADVAVLAARHRLYTAARDATLRAGRDTTAAGRRWASSRSTLSAIARTKRLSRKLNINGLLRHESSGNYFDTRRPQRGTRPSQRDTRGHTQRAQASAQTLPARKKRPLAGPFCSRLFPGSQRETATIRQPERRISMFA